jgi:putative oxygen-independent coproporphyrinogen III oxidase
MRPPLGVYVHVPFCLTRCGYCDFNTYTSGDRGAYVQAALVELDLAAGTLDRPVDTVFFGGGTPTLLSPAQIGALLERLRAAPGLADDVEVTVEANPDTVDQAKLEAIREAGATRVSFGVQSARPHVLDALERVHRPERALAAIGEARAAGFGVISADLIYGTPGESAADWEASLHAVLDAGVDHVSAYGLTVEPGTRLGAQVRRGERSAPDPDTMADRYAAADSVLGAAGLAWYELSNWARGPGARCRHNIGYWRSGDWWGIGPGAHSHVDGTRWWNVRHPGAYATALAEGRAPVAGSETLDADARHLERVMLQLRTVQGLETDVCDRDALERLRDDGLLTVHDGRAILTLRGRQLADHVTRELA